MLAIIGCSSIGGRVESFADTEKLTKGKSVVVLGFPKDVDESLEFASYRPIIERHFASKGFVITNDTTGSDLVAFVTYGIDDGQASTSIVSTPIIGKTGGGTSTFSGSISSSTGRPVSSFSGSTYSPPTYGIVGTATRSERSVFFMRILTITIADRRSLQEGTPKLYYQGTIKSEGPCGILSKVIREMADGLFSKFPDQSGTIKVRRKENC